MEDDKLVAYYDELTRKGEGAARFKQGLGFSSTDDSAPSRGSAFPSSSSFLSSFVKSSSTPAETSKIEKEAQVQSIQNKLKKNPKDEPPPRVSERNTRESSRRNRSRSRERGYRKRSRSRDRYRERRYRRSRSRSRSRERYSDRRRRRSRSRSRDRRSERRYRSRSRSSSPRERRKSEKSNVGTGTDYSKLIKGYDDMTAAEKVKARMKFQLNETVEKDPDKGMGSGWERFEFDKDAPLDDEEIEAAEDDAAVVKHIGQSFRFSALEAKREDQIKAAHDEAMFGAPLPASMKSDSETEAGDNVKESTKTDVAASLLSEKVLAKQQGSWRDRARKTQA